MLIFWSIITQCTHSPSMFFQSHGRSSPTKCSYLLLRNTARGRYCTLGHCAGEIINQKMKRPDLMIGWIRFIISNYSMDLPPWWVGEIPTAKGWWALFQVVLYAQLINAVMIDEVVGFSFFFSVPIQCEISQLLLTLHYGLFHVFNETWGCFCLNVYLKKKEKKERWSQQCESFFLHSAL